MKQISRQDLSQIAQSCHTDRRDLLPIYYFAKAVPGLFLIYFMPCQANITTLHQINVKNLHPVSGPGIQTHNLLIMSLLS